MTDSVLVTGASTGLGLESALTLDCVQHMNSVVPK